MKIDKTQLTTNYKNIPIPAPPLVEEALSFLELAVIPQLKKWVKMKEEVERARESGNFVIGDGRDDYIRQGE